MKNTGVGNDEKVPWFRRHCLRCPNCLTTRHGVNPLETGAVPPDAHTPKSLDPDVQSADSKGLKSRRPEAETPDSQNPALKTTSDSCLVTKLSHYIELTTSERVLLATLEEATEYHSKRDVILSQGSATTDIYVIKTGWLYGHVSNSDGVDLIAELFFPGDFVGLSQLAFDVSTVNYSAATDLALCPFPKNALKTIFMEHPRLVALFFAFTTLERATMIDRLRAMGQMSARDCVGLFFLQTKARLKITGRAGATWFQMPLSQELIGNAVGLSTVSVNRAIRQLEAEGHIRREGRMMEIVRPEVLGRELDFSDRHYRVDNSWFPKLD